MFKCNSEHERFKEKISVIIAVYNTKKYLNQCIDSILNQTYVNLELIIIDDGSSDGSTEICKEYQEKDRRVKYIRQENNGVSASRNHGLSKAIGKFVYFADSDDFLEIDMLEILYDLLITHDAQISASQWKAEYNDDKACPIIRDLNENIKVCRYNSEEALISLFDFNTFLGFGWNKLFIRSLLDNNNIRFDESLYMLEDELFCCEAILKANALVYTSQKLYHYRMTGNSSTRSEQMIFNPRLLQRVTAIEKVGRIIKVTNSTEVLKAFKCRRMLIDIEAIRYLFLHNKYTSSKVQLIVKRIRINLVTYLLKATNYGGLQYRIAAILISLSPGLFFKVLLLKNKNINNNFKLQQ